jgi:hypothetical protein
MIRFIVFLLAVYRATRLIIEDEILDGPRDWAYSKVKPGGKLAYLLGCPWCMSFWVAIPLAILYVVSPTGMMVAGLPLAGSAVTGLIYQKVG